MEREQRAVIAAPRAPSEAARILSLAQAAFGDLRGLIAGTDDGLLDRPPAPGEWSLRETLAHAIVVERSYRAQVVYSSRREEALPIAMPPADRPSADPRDSAGGVSDIVATLARRREETDGALGTLDDAALERPTIWGGWTVDLRHRLHRFASHLAEHTIQAEKVLAALGASGGDARAIARRIGALRGIHERRSNGATLAELDDALAAKVTALGA